MLRPIQSTSISQLLQLSPLQARTRDLARSLTHWRRHRRLFRRGPPRTHLPHRHEPRCARPPALAAHWLHRVDRRLRPGWLCIAPLPHRRPRVARRYQESPALVSRPVKPFL